MPWSVTRTVSPHLGIWWPAYISFLNIKNIANVFNVLWHFILFSPMFFYTYGRNSARHLDWVAYTGRIVREPGASANKAVANTTAKLLNTELYHSIPTSFPSLQRRRGTRGSNRRLNETTGWRYLARNGLPVSAAVTSCPKQDAVDFLVIHQPLRSLLGPFYGAIAVPFVTRCRCCCCGHRFYIAIRQVSLLSHATCAIAIAGFGSSW